MKILSNKEYESLQKNSLNLKTELICLEQERKKDLKFYGELLDEIYDDLAELNHCLKQKISREKIQIRIQNLIIKIGGKR